MNKNELLDNLKKQIESFDNKASILLTVIGFIIAFTTNFSTMLDVYKSSTPAELDLRYYVLVVLLVCYFTSLLISGGLFVSVIFPRKRNANLSKSNSYYMDIADIKLEEKINIDILSNDIDGRIWMNSKICTIKHRLLEFGCYILGLAATCFIIIMMYSIFS